MTDYILYSDESGNFKDTRQRPWLVGGIWGAQKSFDRLSDFVAGLRMHYAIEDSASVSQWARNSEQLDYDLVATVLKEVIDELEARNIRFVCIQHIQDCYRSDDDPVARYTHMLLALGGNLAGRNPLLDAQDKVTLHAASRHDGQGGTILNETIFKATWDVYTDHGLIRPMNNPVLRSSSAYYQKFGAPFFLADFLLGIQRMLLQDSRLPAEIPELIVRLERYCFSYDKLWQLTFERLAQSFNQQDWSTFAESLITLRRLKPERPEQAESYFTLAEDFETCAIELWQKKPSQAIKLIEWVVMAVSLRQPERYPLLAKVLDALEQHPELAKHQDVVRARFMLENHSGSSKQSSAAVHFRTAEQHLGQMNVDASRLAHVFRFHEALDQVEYCCMVREEFCRNVFGKDEPFEDALLAKCVSHRGQIKSWLGEYEAAYADFEAALNWFGADKVNQAVTLSYALLAASNDGNLEKVKSFRKRCLDAYQVRPGRIAQLLTEPANIPTGQAFLIRAVLKSLQLVSDEQITPVIEKLERNVVQKYSRMISEHPSESILIHLGRLTHQSKPDMARQIFEQAFSLHVDSNKTILWLLSGAAAAWGGLLSEDEGFARKGLARLIQLKELGQFPSLVSPILDGSGWFDYALSQSTWQAQAKGFVDGLNLTYL